MNCPKCGYVMSDLDVECPRCKRLEQQEIQPKSAPPPSAATAPYQQPHQHPYAQSRPSVEYASFWVRVAASVIDGLATLVAGSILRAVGGAFIGGSMGAAGASPEDIAWAATDMGILSGIVVYWLYDAFMESSSYQATLGKMAFGLVVTDLDGNRISFARATGRHFADYLSALILCAGYLMVGFTEKKQALHDMIAGTLVVRR